jgi:hypothetical protein
MKDLGEFSHFLGLEVSSLKGGIFVSQQGYKEACGKIWAKPKQVVLHSS